METIQVVLDKKLLKATDRAARHTKQNRSALLRDALQARGAGAWKSHSKLSHGVAFGAGLPVRHWWVDLSSLRATSGPGTRKSCGGESSTDFGFRSIGRMRIGWPSWAAGSAKGHEKIRSNTPKSGAKARFLHIRGRSWRSCAARLVLLWSLRFRRRVAVCKPPANRHCNHIFDWPARFCRADN